QIKTDTTEKLSVIGARSRNDRFGREARTKLGIDRAGDDGRIRRTAGRPKEDRQCDNCPHAVITSLEVASRRAWPSGTAVLNPAARCQSLRQFNTQELSIVANIQPAIGERR